MKQKSLPVGRQGFTLIELLVVITILGILASIGLNTFTSAQKKSRDAKRKGHLKQISDALQSYSNDNADNEYPDDGSDSGNIYGCGEDALEECTWGETAFQNDDTGTVYMIQMPQDNTAGSNYYYDAETVSGYVRKFILCTRLENTNDIDVPKDDDNNPLVYRNIDDSTDSDCGTYACNYCTSSPNTPLPETTTE